MTTYTVYIYREMCLSFPGIKASSHEEAARLAASKETEDAAACEECQGFTTSALVDRDDDPDHEFSRTIFLRADGGEIEPLPDRATNRDRAAWAEAAISVFMQHTECDREEALPDLLANLMHWAAKNGRNFPAALDRALRHFTLELAQEHRPSHDLLVGIAQTTGGAQ